MRASSAKPKEPARHTRSGAAGKKVAPGPRPKRTAAKQKPKAPLKKNETKKATCAPNNTNTANNYTNKPKPAAKKVVKKEQLDHAHDEIKSEPVEVVISVKNPRRKTEPAKMGVTSGKVGKRKGKHKDKIKKEVLKKISSKSDEKLEDLVNTIVEVAVKKVVPKKDIKTEIKTKEKPKKDLKKKTENKKEKEEKNKTVDQVKKEKEEPIKKDTEKKPKENKKEIKQEKKLKDVMKPVMEIKEENKKEMKTKEEKNKEDKKEETKEVAKPDKIIKKEKDTTEDKEKEKKKVGKPKSKPKEKKEIKKPQALVQQKEDSASDKKITKPKVKLEKVSPVTVKDEDISVEETEPSETKSSKAKKPPPKPKQRRFVKKKTTPRKTAISYLGDKDCPIIEKRHREASLNALAKVHCLYENESRGAMNEMLDKTIPKKKEDIKVEKVDVEETAEEEEEQNVEVEEEKPQRNLRSAPGMRGVGRHWDILNASSTSSSEAEDTVSEKQEEEEEPKEEQKPVEKKTRKRRKRCELMMDLKDMVVRKRMASLNASAMMAASYSVEKRSKSDDRRDYSRSSDDSTSSAVADSSDDEVTVVSGSSKKVAVIVNQDTDVTITGLYTTRSTRHEGYCSIAGMQYRISSTSHTQTEATAVSTETVIHTTDHVSVSHSESGGSVDAGGTSSPGGSCKSYTPLGALSSMQPPGQGRPCGSSAFSAPPYHPHPQDLHGYYQPAGPLISHGSSGSKSATPEPYPPHPYPYPAYDYPGYYRGYRRPWASTSQMMDYLDYPPPHPSYYPYPTPPPPPPPPPPAPPCYSSPVRGLPYMEQAFQTCPCPMQSSCPKNVHTGPLTGASKRSESVQNDVAPLVPIALALPPEPTGGSPGPPSPARGSAGMPPPASPALSTARNSSWSPPAQGLIPSTPPPTLTVVEPSPSPAASVIVPQATIQRKATKRASTEALEVPKKKKKSASISMPNSKKLFRGSKKGTKTKLVTKPESVEDEMKVDPKNNTELALRRNPGLKWSNGWHWEGESYRAKVFLTTEDTGVIRTCYPAMRHKEGDVIRPKDCILLRSGPRKNLPFVAKISAMWENPDDGEMMVSVLWYYRPEHTEQGRLPDQPPDEIFASKHKDTNSVACIEDRCYVLTYHEYCRYRKSLVNGGQKCHTVVPPLPEGYPRDDKLPPHRVSSDLIFFCRQIYDFRQKKILKKPPSQPHPRS